MTVTVLGIHLKSNMEQKGRVQALNNEGCFAIYGFSPLKRATGSGRMFSRISRFEI